MIKIIPYTSYKPVTEYAVTQQMGSAGDDNRDVVFIVPEAVKASVERLVFDRLTEGRSADYDISTTFGNVSAGSLKYDVLSFVRLSYKILTMTGRASESDNTLLRNVIYRVLTDHPSDFPNFNKLRFHFEYIDMLVDLIGDFRRYGIGTDRISELIDSEGDDDGKLSEIVLLLERIEQIGAEYCLPVNETLPDKACGIIASVISEEGSVGRRTMKPLLSYLKSKFVIIGLGSTRNLTPQELRLIKMLSDAGAEVVVYASVRDDAGRSSFSEFGENTIDALEQIGGSIVSDPVKLNSAVNNRLNDVSVHYAMDELGYNCPMDEDGSVKLMSYAIADDSIAYVANEINRLVRTENKYRFSDIRIFCADDDYKERTRSIFKLFDLSAFIDYKVILLNTPVVRFVLNLLDLSIHNYNVNDVLKFLRTGVLTGARRDLVDFFDNYLIRENIRDKNRLFNEEFYKLTYEVEDDDGESVITKDAFKIFDNGELIYDGAAYLYENVVKNILLKTKEITDAIDEAKTISRKAEVLARYLGSLKSEVEALRDEYYDRDKDTALAIVKGYTEVMELLSSLTGELNDVDISSEQFASLIRMDMKNKATGSIPFCVDSVEISSMESSIYTPCKVMFILGATSSNFPHGSSREGIIPSGKLQMLGLPDKSKMRSKQEFINASMLLNSVEDVLYFITPASEVPSSVFNYYRNAFKRGSKDNPIEYPVVQGTFSTPVYGVPVIREHVAEDSTKTYITPEHMRALLNGRMNCSVTSIEKYNGCPLSYMLDYALRIKVRKDGTKAESGELGSLCHSMFENSMKDVKSSLDAGATIDEIIAKADEAEISRLADEYFRKAISEPQITNPEKYSARYAVNPGLKAKRIFKEAYPTFLEYYLKERCRPEGFEVKLEDQPKKMDIKTKISGEELVFEFKGSIDRVDKNPDGTLRVVDYKTYEKKLKYTKVAEGVQIQLFAYAYGLEMQPGNKVDKIGYIKTYLATSKGAGKDHFEYISAENASKMKYDIRPAIAHSYKKLEEACSNIAKGKATATLTSSEFEEACSFCNFKGLCGRKSGQERPDGSEAEKLAESWIIPKEVKQKGGKK